MSLKIKKILVSLLILKALLACLAAFGYFTHPHVIRQVDTMGISLRYAMKFQDGFELRDLLPTSLASGDYTDEVTPMEFPILNILTSIPFLFSTSFDYALAYIFLILINTFLFFRIYLEFKSINESLSMAWLITPLYGVSYVFSLRFMPDYLAYLLISYGIVLIYKRKNIALALFLSAIALLIKPPVIIAYAFLLTRPKKELPRIITICFVSLLPMIIYYTAGIKYLTSLSFMPDYFSVEARDPIKSFISFFSHPKEIFYLIFKDIFTKYSVILMMLMAITNKLKSSWVLIGLVFLQIFTIAIMDGHHSFMHSYYYLGTSFLVCLIFWQYTEQAKKPLQYVAIIFLLAVNIESSFSQIKPLFRSNYKKECRQILDEIPELKQATHIRTTFSPIAEIGLCVEKIPNSSIAHYGIYKKGEPIPCENSKFETDSFIVCEFLD